MKRVRRLLIIALMALMLCSNMVNVFAAEDADAGNYNNTIDYATGEQKSHVRDKLSRYYSDLKMRNVLSEDQLRRMDKIYNSAMNYMQNANLTYGELESYEASIEDYLSITGRENLLILSNEVPILEAGYGEETTVVLSFINLSNKDITNAVVTPIVSTNKREWPFEIQYAYDAKVVPVIPAAINMTEAHDKRMDIEWHFTVREDVLTGCYPISFHVNYYQNGEPGETDIITYINITGSNPDKLLIEEDKEDEGENLLILSNEVPVLGAGYGEETTVVLSFINLSNKDITNAVVTPIVSTNKREWPFKIQYAYDTKVVPIIPAAINMTEAHDKHMDIEWHFTVREDVLTGCYPISFHVNYYQNGEPGETDIITYINITGSDPDKLLIEEDKEDKFSNPRIIVTGYHTDPEVVYAGTTFNLTVSVKNTSRETVVENVLFNMEATVEGSSSEAAYAAFLPTSGSNSVYAERIAPGQTYEMSIEMEAKSDLAQKPYVLTVNMRYDTEDQINLSDTANVSIPIKQEAKLDTGSADVMPESIEVGSQSNVMFSLFNTGKTTLFNVKVTYESETVESGVTYLGNIAPGETGNVDSMLTGIAPDTGDGIVKAVITYEDESGNESRFEKDINLYVYEMVFEEPGMYEDPGMYEEPIEEDGGNILIPVIIIVVVAVIVAIIVITIIVKKRKKAKQHKEDLDLLDEEDE